MSGGLAGLALLAGCASYAPQPLDQTPHLAASVRELDGGGARALTPPELDRLVLANNPELQAARLKLGVAAAQSALSDILPNPQFTASVPLYISGPNGTNGFTLSVTQDLRAILLRPTKREAAANAAAQVDASLLWQEWQTVGRARLLYVALASGDQLGAVLARHRKLLKERYDVTYASIQLGNAALAALSPDLVALGDIDRAIDDLERQQQQRRHQLAALLGLAPDARLTLAAAPLAAPLDPALVRRDGAALAERRPDLVALQYGYRSQDAKLRAAIIGQFPNMILGGQGGSDNSGVYSAGPQATFDIPIFDRNQGNIAVERATREALSAEFNARLTAATGEIDSLLSQRALLRRQLSRLEPRLAEARRISKLTEAAFKQGAFDERAYVDVAVAALQREQEQIALRQSLLESEVTLSTLTGAGLPSIALEPEPPPANPLGLLTAGR